MQCREIGAIPYRIRKNRLELVLVTTRRGKRWIFPKGHTERQMTSPEVAEMEAFEEAGVLGKIDHRHAREVVVRRGAKRVRLRVYPLKCDKVLNRWPESDQRERMVVSYADALRLLKDKPLCRCVKKILRDVA